MKSRPKILGIFSLCQLTQRHFVSCEFDNQNLKRLDDASVMVVVWIKKKNENVIIVLFLNYKVLVGWIQGLIVIIYLSCPNFLLNRRVVYYNWIAQ